MSDQRLLSLQSLRWVTLKQESLYIIRGPMVSPELTDWLTMPTLGDICPTEALISRHMHKNNMTSQAHASNCIFSLYGNIVVDTLTRCYGWRFGQSKYGATVQCRCVCQRMCVHVCLYACVLACVYIFEVYGKHIVRYFLFQCWH